MAPMTCMTGLVRMMCLMVVLPWLTMGSDADLLWTERVRPLLDQHCVKCHGPLEQKSGLELDTPEAVFRGGDEGRVVVSGDPSKSRLYLYLAPDSDTHMPPRKQLEDGEREWIAEWIRALGRDPEPGFAARLPGETRTFATVTQAVDVLLREGWARRDVSPSAPVPDTVWARRVYLDIAGRIPSADEVARFLEMPSGERREKLVDGLLDGPGYPVRMRELWDVWLMGRPRRDAHEDRRRQNGWWQFMEAAFAENRPWNEVVHDLLVARPPDESRQGAVWFLYERRNDHQAIAEAVAPVVYGTRIDCAQCHDHPLAREILQSHYWGLVAAFNRSRNVDGKIAVAESATGGMIQFTDLHKQSRTARIHLLDGRILEDGDASGETGDAVDRDDLYRDPVEMPRVPKESRREAFARAVTRDNPLLAKAFVNRMWAALLGRGLVHPADEIQQRNTPSHPELLEWLAQDFAASGHDIRRLVRGLVLTEAYGLAAASGSTDGVVAPETFAAFQERPLTAEQLARSWRMAAGWDEEDETLRRVTVRAMPDVLPRHLATSFQQAQFLAYSEDVARQLQPGTAPRVEALVAEPSMEQRVREAFHHVLGRFPEPEESGVVRAFLDERSDRPTEGVRDLLWALMTSAEFLTQP
jgi:hypothetical protein